MSQYVNIASISKSQSSLKVGQMAHKPVYVRGVVIDKNASSSNFFSYVVADREDPDCCFKVIAKDTNYLRLDCMTFEEMNDDVEIGDYVSIIGLPARSKSGNIYINMQYISVTSYGNNKYESESEDSDADYEPESEEEDSDSEYEPESEEEDSDTDYETRMENVSSDYLPKLAELNAPNFHIPEVPIKIYNQFVDYNGHYYKMTAVRVNTPGKLELVTKIGVIEFTKMGSKYIGVYMPANDLELSYKNGYDMIIREKFSDLLEVLY